MPRLAAWLLAVALLAPAPAAACRCQPRPVPEALEAAAAAFAGEVVAKDRVQTGEGPAHRWVRYTLEVDSVWKGRVPRKVEVFTGELDSCRAYLALGRSYVVYPRRRDERLVLTACDRTRPAEEAERIELGPARAPEPFPTEEFPPQDEAPGGWLGEP